MTNLKINAKITLYWYILSSIAFMILHLSLDWSLTASLLAFVVLTIKPTVDVLVRVNHFYPIKNYGLAYGAITTAIALAICKAVGVI